MGEQQMFWTPMKKIFCGLLVVGALAAVVLIVVVAFMADGGDKVPEMEFKRPMWGYRCENRRCMRHELPEDIATTSDLISLGGCQLTCGGAHPYTVWPRTLLAFKPSNRLLPIDPDTVAFRQVNQRVDAWYLDACEKRFHQQLRTISPKGLTLSRTGVGRLTIEVDIGEASMERTLSTPENYELNVQYKDGDVLAHIQAPNFYGARHGLETLLQLIVYDEINNVLIIVGAIHLADAPAFKHRGLSLDTSRNFFSLSALKRTIDGMAMSKLNVLHWHITDSHSFPMEVKSHPEMVELGAYAPYKKYTAADIADLVKYARARGVLLMPEFDQPAHVGEGWQRKKHLVTCFNAQPWQNYCYEPPCGQLDPTQTEVYDILEDIYRDMYDMFDRPPIFHMGGDETTWACWNSTPAIVEWMAQKGWTERSEEDFMKLWDHFQANTLTRLDRVTDNTQLPVILWNSHLTQEPYISQYLDPKRHIIQIWDGAKDEDIERLLSLGHQVIWSNVDALYFDCGFSGWVTDGLNWCSPYKSWQTVYDNRVDLKSGAYVDQVLGAEAALWTEQTDEQALDSRLWPRLSALGERLWSNPATTWRDAETRLHIHRERLVANGIAADRLSPEWCLQNDNQCPIAKV